PAGVGESSSADGSSSRRMARGAAPWPKSIRPIEDVRRPPHIARAVLCEPEGAAATRKGDAPALAGETDTVQERSGGGALRTMVRPTAGALARSQRDCPGETEGGLRGSRCHAPRGGILIPGARRASPGSG
ncbi:unnamed protein product, partial [Prorocentrum cordatum]